MIEVGVRRDGNDRAIQVLGQFIRQPADAKASVDEEVRGAAADQPCVGPHVGVHVRLGDPKDAIACLADVEPSRRHGKFSPRAGLVMHAGLPPLRTHSFVTPEPR